MTKRPTPVFVVGKHRSGTTGLANQLCQNTSIAGVQHEKHWGIHESGYFTYLAGRYGPLDSWTNFREFVEVMSASDYFRLTGLSKKFALSLFPTTYSDFFASIMNEFARRCGTPFWLEKSPSHTKKLTWIARSFPSAKFVAIVRNVEEVVGSTLAKKDLRARSSSRALKIIRTVFGWIYYNKSIFELKQRNEGRIEVVKFEDFREEPKDVLLGICSFIGVEYDEEMLIETYAHNSSFDDSNYRGSSLLVRERMFIRLLAESLEKIPHEMYRVSDILKDCVGTRRHNLPKWFFKLSDQELNLYDQ